MKKALINIDYTFDFVAEEGALTCGKPGQEIESELTRLTQSFIDNEELVVFAIDRHKKDDPFHPETPLFPPHNIEGTEGRHLYGSLQQTFEQNKHLNHVMWLDKTRYSAFAGTNLDLVLTERTIRELHLVGVCTDICVLHTAVDAYNKGYKIVIHEKAVASFNQKGHEWALEHFQSSLNATIQ
ncbi:cysteine hydrolase family protein [Bacillus weihaiensis]|uniref:Isochorismatase n=1 Tax=Bacillus weihaiensis TaxID=1547283 RepID=A0A1L3MS04_9BACI|nr:isochorismatase family cysteine hydrolase [Bacillus weihaiensis]APH05116.1 isochorismatase [Bacillus weihaiensis]